MKMPPADGSICGAEVLEVEKCMMPECRKSQPRRDQELFWHLLHAKAGEKCQITKIASNCERGYFRNVTVTDLCVDTIPCMLTPWSEWSDCSVTCGKGLRTRKRMLKSPVELGDCTEELEQVEKCMLPECRK